jgi:tRNA (cmo5U34)-methyltransferase
MAKNYDYEKIRQKSLQAPRLTTLWQHFEEIAEGNIQKVDVPLMVAPEFLMRDVETAGYFELLKSNISTFGKHFSGSIPLALEEACRMGLAVCRYAQQRVTKDNPFFAYYETSSTGKDGRTIAEYTSGLVRTLTDSPSKVNERNFYAALRNDFSKFHLGPFVDISPELLATHPDWDYFRNGFDMIHESTTFQFYGPEREEQMAYLIRVLKPDGIIVFEEKFNHPDPTEYQRREQVKDQLHKTKYFSAEAIGWKKSNMLATMENGQVDLDTFFKAAKAHFTFAYISWNSTNFYHIACSNNYESLQQYITCLGEPFMPAPFKCDENVPRFIKL